MYWIPAYTLSNYLIITAVFTTSWCYWYFYLIHLFMFSYLASNVVYNETEYFAFLNIRLITLFMHVVVYPVTINTTSLFFNTIKFNDNWMELISTLFSIVFLVAVLSPSLLILLESDINILPSPFIQSPAHQRARSFSPTIITAPTTDHDHLLITSSYSNWWPWSFSLNKPFYLSDVNAYSLIPIWSSVKVYVVATDVIHPPGFYTSGIKIDAIPGRINPATTSRSLMKGENRGFRSESRGQSHSTTLLIALTLLP